MAAFAMFSLKEPSLLAFDARRQDRSLINLYRLGSIPFRHPAPGDPRSGRSRCFERMLRRPLLRTVTRRSAQTLRLRRVIEDALSSNGPHIKNLIELNFAFILGAKPGDHAYLFDHFAKADSLGLVDGVQTAAVGKKPAASTRWNDHLQLNASHRELEVGLIDHQEFGADGLVVGRFSWVTGLPIDACRVVQWVRGGRCRPAVVLSVVCRGGGLFQDDASVLAPRPLQL